jgi:TonB family protein
VLKSKLIAFLIVVGSMSNAQTIDQKVRIKAEKFLKENMNDPSSYQFVSLKALDPVTYQDNIDDELAPLESDIRMEQITLDIYTDNPEYHFDAILEGKTKIENAKLLRAKLDSIKKSLNTKLGTVTLYNYSLKCRGKNAFGALVLNEYLVQVAPKNLELVNMVSNYKDGYYTYGGFPGYKYYQELKDQIEAKPNKIAQDYSDSIRAASQRHIVVKSTPAQPVAETFNDDRVMMVVEEQPEYEGGYEAMIDFVRKNLEYPASARRVGIKGTVYVSFVVGKDGLVSDVQVLRGISVDCDNEAKRVISIMPPWKPGKQNGKYMNVRMNLPIKFK